MEIITDCEQGSDAWHQHRLCSLGASSMQKVLAGKKERADLLRQFALEKITGQKTETYSNANLVNGLTAEPLIRREYEFITGNKVDQVALIKSDIDGCHISPDGLVAEDGGTEIKNRIRKIQFEYVEARKNPSGKYQPKLYAGIPTLGVYTQVQGSLWVSKREWWDYVSACVIVNEYGELAFDYAMGDYIIIQRVYRDEDYIKTIEKEVISFLAELNRLIEKLK